MSYKKDRVASIIKLSISEMLTFELRDPDIGFATITDVEVTNDLSIAKVFVTFLGTKRDGAKGLEALNRAKGKIRSYVSHKLDTRRCPDLIFIIDDSLEKGNRIEAIIEELNSENK